MKNKITLILAMLAIVPVTIIAASTNETSNLTTTLSTSFVSQYMFRGVRLGGASSQSYVESSYKNFTVGGWVNVPVIDKVIGVSDPELDVYASYAFNVCGVGISPGVTTYICPNASTSDGSYICTVEPNLSLSYTIKGITLNPKMYYDIMMQGFTFEFNSAYSVPLNYFHTELDFVGTIGGYQWNNSVKNANPKVMNHGNYYLIGVNMPFNLNEHWKLVPSVAYTDSINNYFKSAGIKSNNDAAVGRVVAGIALSYSF